MFSACSNLVPRVAKRKPSSLEQWFSNLSVFSILNRTLQGLCNQVPSSFTGSAPTTVWTDCDLSKSPAWLFPFLGPLPLPSFLQLKWSSCATSIRSLMHSQNQCPHLLIHHHPLWFLITELFIIMCVILIYEHTQHSMWHIDDNLELFPEVNWENFLNTVAYYQRR